MAILRQLGTGVLTATLREAIPCVVRTVLLLAGLPLLVLAALLMLADTPAGRPLLEVAIRWGAAFGGISVTVRDIGGRLPWAPTISSLALGDKDGIWLEIDGLRLAVDPGPLLRGERLRIDDLSARRIAVRRLPPAGVAPEKAAEPAAAATPDLSGLPMPVDLRRLEVARLELPELPDPIAIRLGGALDPVSGRLTVTELAVTLGEARIMGSASLDVVTLRGAGRLEVSVPVLSRVEPLIALAGGGPALSGGIDARLSAETTGETGQRFGFDINARNLAVAGNDVGALRLEAAGGTKGAVTNLSGRLTGLRVPAMAEAGLAAVDSDFSVRYGDADGHGGLTGSVTARSRDGHLRADASGTLGDAGRIDSRLRATLDLRLLDTVLAASGDQMTGSLNADVTVGGTTTAPRFGGKLAMSGGSYSRQMAGVTFTGIGLAASGDGEKLRIETLSAKTPNGGTVSLSGEVVPAAGPRLDLTLKAANARLFDTAMATVDADAALSLRGTPDAADVRGTIALQQVDIRIPRQLPPGVVELPVEEIGRSPVTGKPMARPRSAPPEPPVTGTGSNAAAGIALAVDVSTARYVKVTGQGFDGEFTGNIAVRGTAAVPDVAGKLLLRRGSLSVLGRDFRFTRGELDFDGGPVIDPRLDVVAETAAGSDTARILVTGSPRKPEIAFQSANGLPSDEVVAQILFGKTSDRLSAGQAIELASAVAQLGGFAGVGDLVGGLRRKLGLDRLDVGTSSNGNVTVEAGRRIADGVYVGIEQGGTSGPRGTVEVEISSGIKLKAGVDGRGDPEVGIGFELDY